MGQYFMMSKRLKHQTPADFGLIEADTGDYVVHPDDNSRWIRCNLYDFGWGREIGYYRVPLPRFSELLQILLESNDIDDIYGSAAMIMEKYPNDLLACCEELFTLPIDYDSAEKMIKVLQLDQCINRIPIQGKSFNEIENDFMRWQEVGRKAKSLLCQRPAKKKSPQT